MTNRYLLPVISEDALKSGKMAFLSGPRQVGKTSLALQCVPSRTNYFTWDDTVFKKQWVRDPRAAIANIEPGPVVLDELHKYRFWKRTLKGLYDQVGHDVPLIVTGSARLDLYQRGGDSLLGRYLPYRLHPFTIAERTSNFPDPDHLTPQPIAFPLTDLLQCTGFPEPLLAGSSAKAARWSRLRLERLVREDVRDFKGIRDLELMKLLIELLPDRVGSPLSVNSLKEDLQVAYATVREWLMVAKHLYICFGIAPFARNIARALTKEQKIYLFDWMPVTNPGARLENLVAVHLLKLCHFWTDTAVGHFKLRYIRTKEKREVDFCVLRDQRPWMLVECKSNQSAIEPALQTMAAQFPKALAFQLTTKPMDRKVPGTNIRVLNVERFLSMGI